MRKEIKVGMVSWINDLPNPIYSTLQAVTLVPDWIPKTYLGSSATSNSAPPDPLTDFKAYQNAHDFRAMAFCDFQVDIDDIGGAITNFSVVSALHDPGWTPAFKMRHWPSTILSFDMSIYSISEFAGEASSVSIVATQNRHASSTIPSVPANETVLVNALIKFRAGKHTDDIGVNDVGAAFHVPWVWCELLLTFVAGRFKLYGQGSLFPSHAWYFNDTCVKTIGQTADHIFPVTRTPFPQTITRLPGAHFANTPAPALTIDTQLLLIYPILSAGAPASSVQQALTDEASRKGAVDTHPFTVAGSGVWSQTM
jgi:hypothetical protein